MSERLQDRQDDDPFREPQFHVSLEEVLADPGKRKQYYDERVKAVKEKKPVWMTHGIGIASGPNHCFYYQGQEKGSVRGDDERGYLVQLLVESEDILVTQPIDTQEPIRSLKEAQQLLLDELRKTIQPEES